VAQFGEGYLSGNTREGCYHFFVVYVKFISKGPYILDVKWGVL
jgi:hypothetical protein